MGVKMECLGCAGKWAAMFRGGGGGNGGSSNSTKQQQQQQPQHPPSQGGAIVVVPHHRKNNKIPRPLQLHYNGEYKTKTTLKFIVDIR